MTSFNGIYLSKKESQGRCEKLQFNAEVEPFTAKEGDNNYHTLHLHLPIGTLPPCRGNARGMACEEKVLEGCTFMEKWFEILLLF